MSTQETHGVFFLNSNGIDLKINNTGGAGQYFEYNTLGGIFDFYFLAGPTPVEVSQQYSQVIGPPTMMPYGLSVSTNADTGCKMFTRLPMSSSTTQQLIFPRRLCGVMLIIWIFEKFLP